MSIRGLIERVLNYSPLVAASIYGAVVILLLAATWLALAGIYSGESALAETSSLLERLQGRKAASLADGGTMNGSPFLEGPSVTVAGACRFASAVTRISSSRSSSVAMPWRGRGRPNPRSIEGCSYPEPRPSEPRLPICWIATSSW